jgi:predicted acylesterase/phospholipase RssA
VFAAVIGAADSLADTKPLQALVAKYMTAAMLKEIAAEHKKGRILMIGTTNLDAQRSVIWDIGAIAESGHPDSLELVRKIILASASIPGAFPPIDISVTADGKQYKEMHVDGGVTRQVFLYPPGFSTRDVDKALGWKINRRVYIIRNAKIDPEFAVTKDQLLPIASRSISTLIKTQGIGDLYQIHTTARRDGIDYNLAYIPKDFTVVAKDAFDKAYMNALYDLGYSLGRAGYGWHKMPPGMDPKQN